MAIILNQRGANNESEIALLGTMAFASQRILPAVQNIFLHWSNIKGNSGSISCFYY